MHAFVAAVLLGMTGLDALDVEAEAEPPDGQLGEIEEGIRACEGNPIIRSDRRRQAALAEELLEGGDCGLRQ
jgi:hypothetical protein